jgi:succinate dehydrogenase / fumarate reductase cytochrome b subunit
VEAGDCAVEFIMKLLQRVFGTSLGRKYLMALTGAGLVCFVVAHMVGNLQVFLGPETYNQYAHFLQSTPELLWPARLGLVAMLVVHVWAAVTLSLENRAARPVGYEAAQLPGASLASRTMLLGGAMVGAFVVYHLLHYTVKAPGVNLAGVDFGTFEFKLKGGLAVPDVHRMVIAGFSRPLVSAFYLLGVGFLCLHLHHGVRAMFQSLGFKNQAWAGAINRLAVALAWGLFVGYVSIPAAVLLGFGKGH